MTYHGLTIREGEHAPAMAERTTLRLGGPVMAEAVLAEPGAAALLPDLAKRLGGRLVCLGAGSNILAGEGPLELVLVRNGLAPEITVLAEDKETALSGKTLPVEEFPFTISPPLAGEARWVDQQNIIFVSYERMPRATAFIFTPKASLVSLDGMKYEGKPLTTEPYPFAFHADQVRYTADGTVTLQIDFSCKVDLAALKAALTVTDAQGANLPVTIEPEKDEPLAGIFASRSLKHIEDVVFRDILHPDGL